MKFIIGIFVLYASLTIWNISEKRYDYALMVGISGLVALAPLIINIKDWRDWL